MTFIPEQFSAVRKAQVAAQFDFFHNIANQAFDNASRVVALNLATSRDSVERSTRAAQTLIASRDPRDLLTLGGHAEEQVRSLFAYSRELLGIAGGVQSYAVRSSVPALAPAPQLADAAAETVAQAAEPVVAAQEAAVESAVIESRVVEVAVEPVVAAAPVADAPADAAAAAPAEAAAEPVVVAEPVPAAVAEPAAAAAETIAEPAPVPVAEPKAIAKAVGKGTARAAAVPHPAAAPVEPTEGEALAAKIDVAAPSSKRRK
ncbi:phasin family protein [Massilia consociata]|uniref:Phasin family protein n=1 Tax=Massilia consociata TaxID=760117 RepID=A0ABV6FIH8_9BURK